MQRIFDAFFWTLVALWFALAVSGGIAAMAIFPAARGLPLSLEGYEGFIAAQPEEGRMLVAGFLAERVFAITEGARLVLAPLTVCALLAQFAVAGRGGSSFQRSRLLAIAVASVSLLSGVFWSMPGFTAKDAEYRAAARTGNAEAALAIKPDVDAAHERASRVAGAECMALLALIVLSSASIGRGGAGGRRGGFAPPSGSRSSRRG